MIKAVIFDMYETLITLYESPLYFSTQMALDAGIAEEDFQRLWRPSDHDRTVGKQTLEDILEKILKENHCYSEERLQMLVEKRKRFRRECFRHMHPEIVPLLQELKKRGIGVGLISNCFSEEAEVIRESELFSYFDAVLLSVEQGVKKPDSEIYKRCMEELGVAPEECLYVGDGGSSELEAAAALGMQVVQAVWYLKEGTKQPAKRKPEFRQAETPMEILGMIRVSYWKSEEAAAHIHGWDFSYIEGRYVSGENEMPWDYKEVIRKYLKNTDRVLDMDTGGGEFLLSIGHPYELTAATEGYAPNVVLCREKLGQLGIDFREMSDYTKMPFADETFDVVLNRHGTYDAKEIYRILKPGGLFITQQVGEDNDRELVEKLCPGAKKLFTGHNLEKQATLFEKAGFTTLEKGEVYKPIRFLDTGALVWFAKIIEWEFLDFSVDNCLNELMEVEKEIQEKGAVEGRIHRFYFVMQR